VLASLNWATCQKDYTPGSFLTISIFLVSTDCQQCCPRLNYLLIKSDPNDKSLDLISEKLLRIFYRKLVMTSSLEDSTGLFVFTLNLSTFHKRTSLIVASEYEPHSIIERMAPYLAGSASIVVHTPHVQVSARDSSCCSSISLPY